MPCLADCWPLISRLSNAVNAPGLLFVYLAIYGPLKVANDWPLIIILQTAMSHPRVSFQTLYRTCQTIYNSKLFSLLDFNYLFLFLSESMRFINDTRKQNLRVLLNVVCFFLINFYFPTFRNPKQNITFFELKVLKNVFTIMFSGSLSLTTVASFGAGL